MRRRAYPQKAHAWVYQDTRWQALREWTLDRDHWTCTECGVDLIKGRQRPDSAVVHHITPHRGNEDLAFDPDNLTSVCKSCHDGSIKFEENRGYSDAIDVNGYSTDPRHPANSGKVPKVWGYSIPDGLEPSGIPVNIVCGAPGAGKSRYVGLKAKPGDTVIDLDQVKVKIGGKMWDQTPAIISRSLAYRNEMIKGLAERREGRAWLIISGSTDTERQEWRRALGRKAAVHIVGASEAECISRIRADKRRGAHAMRHIQLVRRWFRVR